MTTSIRLRIYFCFSCFKAYAVSTVMVRLRCPKFFARSSLRKISTAAPKTPRFFRRRRRFGVLTTSIRLRIYFCFSCFKAYAVSTVMVRLRCPKFFARSSLRKISTAAPKTPRFFRRRRRFGVLTTSIRLRIYFCFSCFKAYAVSTVMVRLRCPKFFARCSLRKISTAAPSSPRFICHRQHSAHRPLRYVSVYIFVLVVLKLTRSAPLWSVCGARNFLLAVRFAKFRPRHPLRLVLSATGSTRLIVHFDTSPYIFLF